MNEELSERDHRIIKAMLDGLAMCIAVETEEYPYFETLYEKVQRERANQALAADPQSYRVVAAMLRGLSSVVSQQSPC